MPYKSSKTYRSPSKKTLKNRARVCNLGINGTMKPCCDREMNGHQCHINPELLDHTKRLTRRDTILMTKEHDNYKNAEKRLFGSNVIHSKKYINEILEEEDGIDTIKQNRNVLENIIKMREDWLKKWYIPPTPKTDCYTCDANARNHNIRIDILNQCLDDYNSAILKEGPSSRRTRSKRRKSNFTYKKNNNTRKSNNTKKKQFYLQKKQQHGSETTI
jgi:hypothetical protein